MMIYKNWWVHNCIAHPLMQVFNSIGLRLVALKIHDGTLPIDNQLRQQANPLDKINKARDEAGSALQNWIDEAGD